MYGRLVGRAGDDGGARVGCTPLGGGDMMGRPSVALCESALAPIDELRLMGVARDV